MHPPPNHFQTQTTLLQTYTTPDDLDLDYDNPDPDPTAPPLRIHLDASISIKGTGNTFMLPPLPVSTQPTNQRTPQNPSNEYHEGKLTVKTAAIIAALQRTGVLSSPDADATSAIGRPVEIMLSTGIKVEGSRNVVCYAGCNGASSPNTITNPAARAGSFPSYTAISISAIERAKRKRRAISEPADLPAFKRR